MKNRPWVTGIIAVSSPMPLFCFTILWSWVWTFGIGMGLLGYDEIPQWILIFALHPLLISPALGVFGIIHGAVKAKEKCAWLGMLLSVLCLAENFLLVYAIQCIGSSY
jgi:hypothetical protein